MPKTLYLVRHAKSSWVNPSYSDFDRPLNSQGKHDAPEMGRRLAAKGIRPDTIICSPARRAVETLELLNQELGTPENTIYMQKRLYEASAETLLKIVQGLDNQHKSALLLGHNPSLSWAVAELSGRAQGNLPTCAAAAVELDSDDWTLAGLCTAKLLFLDYPKNGA